MKLKLMILAVIVLMAGNAYALSDRDATSLAEKAYAKKVARDKIPSFSNGMQTGVYKYETKMANAPQAGSYVVSVAEEENPYHPVIDFNGNVVDMSNGDPRPPIVFMRAWGLLMILVPFAVIGMIPAYSNRAIFFDHPGEVAVNVISAVVMVAALMIFPVDYKDLGILLFWMAAAALIVFNVVMSYKSNEGSVFVPLIVGLGKAPAAIIAAFFIATNLMGCGAVRRAGESMEACAARDVGVRIQGIAQAVALTWWLGSLINGDRVRDSRHVKIEYNPYEGTFGQGTWR